jgi:hypothetical protein
MQMQMQMQMQNQDSPAWTVPRGTIQGDQHPAVPANKQLSRTGQIATREIVLCASNILHAAENSRLIKRIFIHGDSIPRSVPARTHRPISCSTWNISWGGILSGISNQPLIQNARLGEYAEFTNFVVTPTFLVFFQPIDTFAAISGSMSALATPNS